MINEERVKLMTKMAAHEKYSGEECTPMVEYYRRDYIWKQMLISIVTGTLAFALLVLLAVFHDLESVLALFADLNFKAGAMRVGVRYGCFMAVYLCITFVVYQIRYTKGRKRVKHFYAEVSALEKIYEREESDTKPMGGVS